MRFFTTEILSPNRELTPEGYLLCKAAPIARTGVMFYASGEVPITPLDGLIRIERSPEEVFRERTMASFEGKPFTIDHPAVDVTPDNWRQLASGVVQNVRRGAGVEQDLLIADILVTDRDAIDAIEADTVELSAGYDADYEQVGPGRGVQRNILGNHVALVEKGRCGSRCAIGDRDTIMAAVAIPPKKTKWSDRLRAAFKARDEEAMEKALSESPTVDDGEETEEEKKKKREAEEAKTGDGWAKVAAALKTIDARLAALETRDAKANDGDEDEDKKKDPDADGKTEDEDEDEDEDKKKKESADKARDSAAVVTEAQDVFARAEILAPGLSLPTVDAAHPVKMRDSLCAVRRKALETAYAGKYRDAVTPFTGANPDFEKLTCDALHGAFIGASELVKRENNAQTKVTYDLKTPGGVAGSISAINARNSQFWSRQ